MEDRVIEVKLLSLLKGEKIRLLPHRKNKIILHQSNCFLLEMEDVLFHSGSAVMMPDNPEGRSSRDGERDKEQMRVSGIRALSLVFREIQENPSKRILICGHSDRDGVEERNFKVSELRAKGVYHFLVGEREKWAKVSEEMHTVEDIQQIMKYYSLTKGWLCDPGEVDNRWGRKTEEAVKEFIFSHNKFFGYKSGYKIGEDVFEIVKNTQMWPYEIWLGVYDLYEEELIRVISGGEIIDKKIESLREIIKRSFVDLRKPYVGCGRSFSKEKHLGIRYRSQQDRRVEILFFDKGEEPSIDCPEEKRRVHSEEECPLRKGGCFRFEYIDSSKYFTSTYYLKFEYYDRIKREMVSVPDGLKIRVWKEGGIELKSRSEYKDGIYKIRVEGVSESPKERGIYFTFETEERKYVYTQDKESDRVIVGDSELVKMLSEEKESLPEEERDKAPTRFEELPLRRKLHYYDLPKKWDSRNWEVRVGIFLGRFEEGVLRDSSIEEPLIFNLDDIVFVNEDLTPIVWNKENRFTMFSMKMEIVGADEDCPYFSMNKIDRNYLRFIDISGVEEGVRVIGLKGDFYDVSDLRTVKGEVIGTRAAVLNDKRIHCYDKRIRERVVKGAGHYDIHYFRECFDREGKEVCVMLVYWSAHLKIGNGNVTTVDLDNFRRNGFTGSKRRWESKGYYFEPEVDPEGRCIRVIPKFFFEENTQISKPHCIVAIHDPKDPNYRSSMGVDSANFAKNTYEPRMNIKSKSEDGNTYNWYTMAHELGHACGFDDEYVEPIEEDKRREPLIPRFEQWYPGMPYSVDSDSMMESNCCPRLRHFWTLCRWLNEDEGVRKLTGGTLFRVCHNGNQGNSRYVFRYFLPEKAKNFYRPIYEGEIRNGSSGRCNLYLYRLGMDETTKIEYVKIIEGESDFDGILVLSVKIKWYFRNYIGRDKTDWLSKEEMVQEIRDFQKEVLKKLNNRYWLEHRDKSRDLKKIYLYFFPQHQFEDKGKGGEDFTVVVRKDSIYGQVASEIYNGRHIEVPINTDVMKLFRYMLGLEYKNKSGVEIGLDELGFILRWLKDKTGVDYVCRKKERGKGI